LRLATDRCVLIGGVEIVVSTPPSVKPRITDPLYRQFQGRFAGAPPVQRISVRLICDAWPPARDVEKVFDTRDSWSLCRDGRDYWLSLAPPRRQTPLWVARFDRGVKRVDLYCQAGPAEGRGTREVLLPLVYPLDQLLLMYFFARRKGILAHAAGIVRGGRAFIFAGASGAGKSTFSELLVKAGIGKMLSDERMIVRETGGEMTAFGTPWAGTAGIARSGSAPLAGIFFLRHGRSNDIASLDPVPAADRMLPMITVPWYDPDTAAPIIAFARRLFARVPAYEFRFAPDRPAADCFWEFVKKMFGRS
jgi:hypothetical protein